MRRRQIVAAARQVVAERGLEALTIAALEARLHFTRGVITYHFRDKDEIVMAVLESALEEIDAATVAEVKASHSLEDKVRAVVRTKVEGFVSHVESGRILLSFWGRIGSTPAIRAANARLYAGYRRQSQQLLEKAREEGHAPDLAVEAFAALLVGVVIGIVAQAYFEPGAIDVQGAVREASEAMASRIAAQRRRSPPRSRTAGARKRPGGLKAAPGAARRRSR